MQIRSCNGQSRTEAHRNPSESPEHVPRAEGAKLNWTGHIGVVWTIRSDWFVWKEDADLSLTSRIPF